MKKQTKRMAQSGALFAAFCMVPFSQVATAEVSISGWINEGLTYFDDGDASDIVQTTDNGTTLASRITFSGSKEVAGGVTAGFEVITEPIRGETPLIFGNQENFDNNGSFGIGVLGSSVNVGGSWGKITVGRQSMPTDNIAVLEDPSLTLWSGISPIFRGNGFFIRGAEDANGMYQVVDAAGVVIVDANNNPFVAEGVNSFNADTFDVSGFTGGFEQVIVDPTVPTPDPTTTATADGLGEAISAQTAPVWGDFLNCFTEPGLRAGGGIGIDCNGVYRSGIRYDLPALGPVSIALGAANDDIYDIAAKYKGQMGRLSAQIAVGYAINQGVDATPPLKSSGAPNPAANVVYDEAENFQLQAGVMDTVTGIFGTIAYQYEEVDLLAEAAAASAAMAGTVSDESDAWWIKVGIKRQFMSLGDTSIAFDYGLYNDQYSFRAAIAGVTGSEVQRIGISIDQYFGDGLIIYGKWENLELDVDGTPFATSSYNGGDELDTFTLGFTYFF